MCTAASRRVWLAIAILASLILLGPGKLWAHASLVRSAPADGSLLVDSPHEVRLWFDEEISPRFSSAKLLDLHGRALEVPSVRRDSADPKMLVLTLQALPEGIYSVLATTLSETDGHFSRSFLVFGVGDVGDPSAAAAPSTEAAPPLFEVLLRWGNFALLAGLIGAIAVVEFVLGAGRLAALPDRPWASMLFLTEARVLKFALLCTAATFVVGLELLHFQAVTLRAALPDDVSLGNVLRQLLGGSRWGALWLVRQLLLLAVFGLVLAVYRTRRPGPSARLASSDAEHSHKPFTAAGWQQRRTLIWLAAALTAVALAFTQALTSHAAALETNTGLAIVTDALHLLAAGVWVGGVFALAVGLLPIMWRHRSASFALARAAWGAFSPVAAIAVGLILATGLYAMSRQVASVDALIGTLYGQALASKISLVLAAGAFGLANSMLLHPRVAAPVAWLLRRPRGWTPLHLHDLPKLVLCEAALALLVLLGTAIVTASPAPRGPAFTVAAEDAPTALSQVEDDMVVTLLVKPNRPGQNVFTVFAASGRRPAPAEVMRVICRFTNADREMGRISAIAKEVEPGRFVLGGNYLSLAGRWRIEVAVRRRGLEDSVARFDWLVPPPGNARPVILSKDPLSRPLTLAAAATLSILALVIFLVTLTSWKKNKAQLGQLSGKTVGERSVVILGFKPESKALAGKDSGVDKGPSGREGRPRAEAGVKSAGGG